MSLIKSITAYKVLNSRSDWTVRAQVTLEDGTVASQTVPEGASKGENESISVPIDEAIRNIRIDIAPALVGKSPFNQRDIDETMIKLDGTDNDSNLGGNAVLAVSLAVAKVAAKSQGKELYTYLRDLYLEGNDSADSGEAPKGSDFKFPTPVFNILNGGKHAQNGLPFQEFMVIPAMNLSYEKKLEVGVACYKTLKEHLHSEDLSIGVGDEGGFAPVGLSVKEALDKLVSAVKEANFTLGKDVFLGTDVAAGSFYDQERSLYIFEDAGMELTTDEFFDFYEGLLKDYPLIYVEDPLFEADFAAWHKFFGRFKEKTMVVGDDLVVTNAKILEKALQEKTINAVIVKPNQVGSLTETFDFVRLAQENGLVVTVSHRSGDTAEDTFVSDLALAVGADFVKFGATARGERVVKYNRILEIYHQKT
ncbi:phosphopyruvate hydratase [candidate division WWE3 bacterium]|nr:phosphopyruvate hydratase [candidate division WWE3 bacterium]